MSVSHIKRSREEISLLQGITSTLETYAPNNTDSETGEGGIVLPAVNLNSKTLTPPMQFNQSGKSAVGTSQDAAKNFLAEKTLIKSISKACLAVRAAATDTAVIDQLIKKYKDGYSGLTLKKVVDGISRASSSNIEDVASDKKCSENNNNNSSEPADAESEEVAPEEDGDKALRCIALIDEEMKQYYVKIAEIKAVRKKKEAKAARKAKRKREKAAAAAAAKETGTNTSNTTATTDVAPKKRAKKRKRTTKSDKTVDVDPDDALYAEMTERYYRIKETTEHLPSRALERIIEETKRDMHRDDFTVPHRTVYSEIKKRWKKRSDLGATAEGEQVKKVKEMYEELYKRYCEMKSTQKKLSAGAFAALKKSVKEEFGLPHDFVINKNRITYRYRRDFPDHKANPDHVIEIRNLSSEDKKRREQLVNEVVARYVREKDANTAKKLPKGTVERIVEECKNDLNIHDFDVPTSSIRGRLHRKSYYVSHENGNLDDIDGSLVDSINSWLKSGMSVTRDQGLQLANQILAEQNLNKDSNGNMVTLDAVWWKCFLNRNHHKLITERHGLN